MNLHTHEFQLTQVRKTRLGSCKPSVLLVPPQTLLTPVISLLQQTIGKEFRELTPDMKQAYQETAAKLKTAVHGQRAVIKAAQPRQTPSAYILFYVSKHKEVRAANPTAVSIDIAQLIGKEWRGLSEPQKQLFRAEAASKMASVV